MFLWPVHLQRQRRRAEAPRQGRGHLRPHRGRGGQAAAGAAGAAGVRSHAHLRGADVGRLKLGQVGAAAALQHRSRCLPEPAGALLQELRGSADALVSRVPPYGYAQPQPALHAVDQHPAWHVGRRPHQWPPHGGPGHAAPAVAHGGGEGEARQVRQGPGAAADAGPRHCRRRGAALVVCRGVRGAKKSKSDPAAPAVEGVAGQ
mmetsp:Transcript_72851/g.115771  ORF Transcript_72851/g.115771 Transcript_72851/m.115771 type:complete len:204 (+) Transcript_72851:1462-2073(+)